MYMYSDVKRKTYNTDGNREVFSMNRNRMYMIAAGTLWFAFGYALKGYDAAAVCTALIAAGTAAAANRDVRFRDLAWQACLPAFAALILLHMSGLRHLFASLPAVVLANIVTKRWFLENGTRGVRDGLRIEFYVMTGMLVLALAMPVNLISEMIPDPKRAFADLILLLGLIFAPSMSFYWRKALQASEFRILFEHRKTLN